MKNLFASNEVFGKWSCRILMENVNIFLQETEGSNLNTSKKESLKLRIESEVPGMKNTGCLFYRVSEYGSFIA